MLSTCLFASNSFKKTCYSLSINKTDISKDLSIEQKTMLLNTYSKNSLSSVLLNLFVGFGSGSFYQKQYIQGSIQAFIDLTSISLLLTGVFAFPCNKYPNYFVITGLSLFIANRVYQVISPIVVSKIENDKLRDFLEIDVSLQAIVFSIKV